MFPMRSRPPRLPPRGPVSPYSSGSEGVREPFSEFRDAQRKAMMAGVLLAFAILALVFFLAFALAGRPSDVGIALSALAAGVLAAVYAVARAKLRGLTAGPQLGP